jgi:hypothetical protein
MLEERQARLLREHLAVCPACRQVQTDLEKTIALIRALPKVEPPPYLLAGVRRRLAAEPKPGPLIWRILLQPQAQVLMAAAVLMIVVIRGYQPLTLATRDLPATGPAQDISVPQPSPEKNAAVPAAFGQEWDADDRLENAPGAHSVAGRGADAKTPLSKKTHDHLDNESLEKLGDELQSGVALQKPSAPGAADALKYNKTEKLSGKAPNASKDKKAPAESQNGVLKAGEGAAGGGGKLGEAEEKRLAEEAERSGKKDAQAKFELALTPQSETVREAPGISLKGSGQDQLRDASKYKELREQASAGARKETGLENQSAGGGGFGGQAQQNCATFRVATAKPAAVLAAVAAYGSKSQQFAAAPQAQTIYQKVEGKGAAMRSGGGAAVLAPGAQQINLQQSAPTAVEENRAANAQNAMPVMDMAQSAALAQSASQQQARASDGRSFAQTAEKESVTQINLWLTANDYADLLKKVQALGEVQVDNPLANSQSLQRQLSAANSPTNRPAELIPVQIQIRLR